MGFDIDKALTYMVEREGSDLHIKVDSPPVARVHGDLWALKDAGNLTSSDTESALHSIAEENHLPKFKESALKRAQEFDITRILPLYEAYYQRVMEKASAKVSVAVPGMR